MLKNSTEPFTEGYYRTGNYADYLERGPRYHQLAVELDQLFQMLNLCARDESIMDYGCGAGFLALGLMRLGYRNISGWDISEWARLTSGGRGVSVGLRDAKMMIALDVLEHMEDEEIFTAFSAVMPRALIARIPVGLEGQEGFALDISKRDKTHINCKTKTRWESMLKGIGFQTVLRLNMRTIYDTDGVACLLAIKS